jgi:hypothetical protein
MRYLFLIYADERIEAKMTQEQQGHYMKGYHAFTRATRDRNAFPAGEALQSTATATTVRVRGGKTVTTDGPLAETTEQLGGYYLLNCQNLDEAIERGAMIPGAANGSIEVRPILEFGEQA